MLIKHLEKYCSVILVLIPAVAYLNSLCPAVYGGDSGELTAAAYSLGIPHASGYPLYSIIGKLFCLTPFGNIAFRMNLMSAVFTILTVWLVFSIIYRITFSKIAAFTSSAFMSFTPIVWAQATAAEVYSLHIFFVSLLIYILLIWDIKKDFRYLLLLSFAMSLSFCNHLQTVMLLPAFISMIFMRSRESILSFKTAFYSSLLFIIGLTIYVYLPVRTGAGAAIHWGDPNTLDNFISHVSGESHRSAYVFNYGFASYLARFKGCLLSIWNQFGPLLFLSIYGWVRLTGTRWKIFCILVVVFDFFYSLFLNTVSLEITPFNLSSVIIITICMGVGINILLDYIKHRQFIGSKIKVTACVAFCLVPLLSMVFNYSMCDQSKNYTAYDNAENIFRTVDMEGSLILNGDNNIFPAAYGRICEKMREDVNLFDRSNIIFKMPYLGEGDLVYSGKWEDLCKLLEADLVKMIMPEDIYYAEFNPKSIDLPEEFRLVPMGILHKVVEKGTLINLKDADEIWKYYNSESYNDVFSRDFMTKQITVFYHMRRGLHLIDMGLRDLGLQRLKVASMTAEGSGRFHNDLAALYIDLGFLDEAGKELEQVTPYSDDPGTSYNNWGNYYYKKGDIDNAVVSFRKAIELNPENYLFYNNLGLIFMETGKKEMALDAFKKSLNLKHDQGGIKNIIEQNLTE